MDDEKIAMEDLASELAASLEEPEEVKPEETPAQTAEPETKIKFKGEEKTVKELEDIWDNWQKDYTIKTQTAAEIRQQAEEMLRRAEGYYQAAQTFAPQKGPEPEEDDGEPYVTPKKLENILRKVTEPLVNKIEMQDKTLKEQALSREIEKAQTMYPNSDAQEILIQAIAEFKNTGRVNLVDIAKQSHERRSKTEVTLETLPNDWREKIFQQELEKRKQNASKQTITPDSGKTPPLEPEKLKFGDTKNYLEQELRKSLGK